VKRTDKVAVLEQAAETFRSTPHVLLTDFRGMTANQSNDLRRKIRAAGGSYTVVKNRLAKRAAEGTAVERLKDRLVGPCGLAAHESDPIALAKVLTDFAKENPQLRLLTAIVDGKEVLDPQGIKALSALPGILELRARLLALLQTPATLLVRTLGAPGQQVARVVDARRTKIEEGAEV
jgi:large subunit ribosomal protein L10